MKLIMKLKLGVAVVLSALIAVSPFVPMSAQAALTKSNKFIGNIVAGYVPFNFASYWNQVTPENAGKWGSVECFRGYKNWNDLDKSYNYAKQNGFIFKFHTLVWGKQQPEWIKGLSQAQQKEAVIDWFRAAGSRYSGSEFVDVVNEPLHYQPSYKDAIGGAGSTGWDWIVWSFEQARKYFPKSKLLINEFEIISHPKVTDNYIKIINILKRKGLVDGIGIQCHMFNMDTVTTSTMNANLKKLAATGLPIYVSELDMTGNDNTQLARYKEKFPILWENPAVKGITLWGTIEGQTWKSGTHLITAAGAERPALKWLRQYLASSSSVVGNGKTTNPTTTKTTTTNSNFELGTEGWLGNYLSGKPFSSSVWSAKGLKSLQGNIKLSSNSLHVLFKSGNFNFTPNKKMNATVKWTSAANTNSKLGVRLFVEYNNGSSWKSSQWEYINPGTSINLTLDMSKLNRTKIKKYGVQYQGANNSSGSSSVFIDNVYLSK